MGTMAHRKASHVQPLHSCPLEKDDVGEGPEAASFGCLKGGEGRGGEGGNLRSKCAECSLPPDLCTLESYGRKRAR